MLQYADNIASVVACAHTKYSQERTSAVIGMIVVASFFGCWVGGEAHAMFWALYPEGSFAGHVRCLCVLANVACCALTLST